MRSTGALTRRDMLPALRGEAVGPLHDARFWEDDGGQWAIRTGEWKLLGNLQGDVGLYNLGTDIGETTDLVAQHPDVAERLRPQRDRWAAGLAPRIDRRRRREAG